MEALDKAMMYFNFAMSLNDSVFKVFDRLKDSSPSISRKTLRTKGRKFQSQKSRSNRRKARKTT